MFVSSSSSGDVSGSIDDIGFGDVSEAELLLVGCDMKLPASQSKILLQSKHSAGIPKQFPPNDAGKQLPNTCPALNGPVY